MKRTLLIGLIAAGLAFSGTTTSLLAQGGPRQGCNGFGYGGPPKTAEERTARQAACLERNGGICPNGGPRANRQGLGRGRGNGNGQGWRRGARDGTGPRAGTALCPVNNQTQTQK